MKKDIIEKSYFKTIRSTTNQLSENYKPQAFSREINFFKLSEGKRERITGVISEEEIENYPENFSPNVLMRPLYQEMILPNIAYVGGQLELFNADLQQELVRSGELLADPTKWRAALVGWPDLSIKQIKFNIIQVNLELKFLGIKPN